LLRIEKQFINYTGEHKTFPAGIRFDDLRIKYVTTTDSTPKRIFKLISPDKQKHNDHNLRELTFLIPLNGKNYDVTISKNLEGIHGLTKLVIKTTVITILIIIASSLLVNKFVFRRLWRPFYDSITALDKFQLGKRNNLKLPETSTDEFKFMNTNLNKLADRVAKEYLVLKEFTENASHEMQTPLSIIRSKLDLAIQEAQLSEHQSDILKSAYAAIKKLTNLNRSLLLIAKIDNNQFVSFDTINLKIKVKEKIIQFEELWNNKIIISYQLDDSSIYANPDLIDLLLNNLISNSSRHNLQGGNVFIALNNQMLTISNTGKQQALDASRLFKRFYKETPESDTNGLGLAIVKQICEISGIAITYSFAEKKHSFTLRWTNNIG